MVPAPSDVRAHGIYIAADDNGIRHRPFTVVVPVDDANDGGPALWAFPEFFSSGAFGRGRGFWDQRCRGHQSRHDAWPRRRWTIAKTPGFGAFIVSVPGFVDVRFIRRA